MKGQKILFLFIALLLPTCIFVFLRIFGENEFDVPALYVAEHPTIPAGCDSVALPYHIPDSVLARIAGGEGQLSLVLFYKGELSTTSRDQLKRVMDNYKRELKVTEFPLQEGDGRTEKDPLARCIFFLKEPFNTVLVDRMGVVRGQYVSDNREETDRLITEIAIILKKY